MPSSGSGPLSSVLRSSVFGLSSSFLHLRPVIRCERSASLNTKRAPPAHALLSHSRLQTTAGGAAYDPIRKIEVPAKFHMQQLLLSQAFQGWLRFLVLHPSTRTPMGTTPIVNEKLIHVKEDFDFLRLE